MKGGAEPVADTGQGAEEGLAADAVHEHPAFVVEHLGHDVDPGLRHDLLPVWFGAPPSDVPVVVDVRLESRGSRDAVDGDRALGVGRSEDRLRCAARNLHEKSMSRSYKPRTPGRS